MRSRITRAPPLRTGGLAQGTGELVAGAVQGEVPAHHDDRRRGGGEQRAGLLLVGTGEPYHQRPYGGVVADAVDRLDDGACQLLGVHQAHHDRADDASANPRPAQPGGEQRDELRVSRAGTGVDVAGGFQPQVRQPVEREESRAAADDEQRDVSVELGQPYGGTLGRGGVRPRHRLLARVGCTARGDVSGDQGLGAVARGRPAARVLEFHGHAHRHQPFAVPAEGIDLDDRGLGHRERPPHGLDRPRERPAEAEVADAGGAQGTRDLEPGEAPVQRYGNGGRGGGVEADPSGGRDPEHRTAVFRVERDGGIALRALGVLRQDRRPRRAGAQRPQRRRQRRQVLADEHLAAQALAGDGGVGLEHPRRAEPGRRCRRPVLAVHRARPRYRHAAVPKPPERDALDGSHRCLPGSRYVRLTIDRTAVIAQSGYRHAW
jgi:hypothetical protein